MRIPRLHLSVVRRQDGQVLVIFAGGLVVLMLIAALVVDLGFTFMIRRQEQNAADPGAIAAARFIRNAGVVDAVCADTGLGTGCGSMRKAACFYARQNGFFPSATGDDGCIAANDPAGATLVVNYPPSAAAGPYYSGRDGFVEVRISRPHTSFLAGLIGLTRIQVTTNAVAAFSNGDSNSNSLVALDNTGDCSAGNVHGTGGGTIKVTVGGNVHVNSKCPTVPPPTAGACMASGSGGLTVSGTNASLAAPTGQVYVVGECAINGSGAKITTSAPGNAVNQGSVVIGDPLGRLEGPPFDTSVSGQSCGGGTQTSASTNNNGCGSGGGLAWQGTPCPDDNTIKCVTLSPGVYYGGWTVGTKTRLLMNAGIYILAGGGIQQTSSGAIDAITDASGNPGHVMIYSTDNPLYKSTCTSAWSGSAHCQQELKFTARADVKAYGLDDATCTAIPSVCPYVGMFLWQDGKGSCPLMSCPITVGGSNTTLDVAGTIYAPTQQVKIDGGALAGNDGTATVQIISWQWDIGGNANLLMPFDPTKLYHFDQKGLVQ